MEGRAVQLQVTAGDQQTVRPIASRLEGVTSDGRLLVDRDGLASSVASITASLGACLAVSNTSLLDCSSFRARWSLGRPLRHEH
jgi:hypothetical protein